MVLTSRILNRKNPTVYLYTIISGLAIVRSEVCNTTWYAPCCNSPTGNSIGSSAPAGGSCCSHTKWPTTLNSSNLPP